MAYTSVGMNILFNVLTVDGVSNFCVSKISLEFKLSAIIQFLHSLEYYLDHPILFQQLKIL